VTARVFTKLIVAVLGVLAVALAAVNILVTPRVRDSLLAVLGQLVEQHTIYRVKGFVAIPGKPMRLLVQGVGRRFDHHFDRRWRDGEAQRTRLVFIGEDLDEAMLRKALEEVSAVAA